MALLDGIVIREELGAVDVAASGEMGAEAGGRARLLRGASYVSSPSNGCTSKWIQLTFLTSTFSASSSISATAPSSSTGSETTGFSFLGLPLGLGTGSGGIPSPSVCLGRGGSIGQISEISGTGGTSGFPPRLVLPSLGAGVFERRELCRLRFGARSTAASSTGAVFLGLPLPLLGGSTGASEPFSETAMMPFADAFTVRALFKSF